MVLVNLTELEESPSQQFSGFFVFEDITESFNLEIPAAVTADLETLTTDYVAYTYWSVAVQVTDFSVNNIKGFRGDPPRFGFGSMTHLCRNVVTSHHYLNYQNQSFPRQSCLCFPDIFFSYPFEVDDIPAFGIHDILLPIVANQYFPGFNTVRSQDTYRENGGLFGATDTRISLETSVVANICVSYLGHYMNISGSSLRETYFNM